MPLKVKRRKNAKLMFLSDETILVIKESICFYQMKKKNFALKFVKQW